MASSPSTNLVTNPCPLSSVRPFHYPAFFERPTLDGHGQDDIHRVGRLSGGSPHVGDHGAILDKVSGKTGCGRLEAWRFIYRDLGGLKRYDVSVKLTRAKSDAVCASARIALPLAPSIEGNVIGDDD